MTSDLWILLSIMPLGGDFNAYHPAVVMGLIIYLNLKRMVSQNIGVGFKYYQCTGTSILLKNIQFVNCKKFFDWEQSWRKIQFK